MKKTASLTAILFASTAAPASAQLIVPVAETREVLSTADTDDFVNFDSDAESDSAALYEYFVAAVSARAEIENGLADAGASQDSLLGSTYISASGSAFAVGESYDFIVLSRSSSASTVLVEFDLTQKASYHWYGALSASDSGAASVRFSGEGLWTTMSAFGPSESFTIDESGVLDPGRYTVDLRALGSAHAVGEFDYAFADFQMSLELTALAGTYCIAAPNSAGAGASLALAGSQSVADNDFHLVASGARPNGSGLFFYGPNALQVPFGDGFRCIGGQTFRLQPPVSADGAGNAARQVDLQALPAGGAILPRSTWNFQLWYRDPGGPGGSGFNLSDGVWATFCE